MAGINDGWKGEAPRQSLDDYAAELNAKNFTKAQGQHWFVNQRKREDGTTERYLDRRENWTQTFERWKPSEAELNALKANLSRVGARMNTPPNTERG